MRRALVLSGGGCRGAFEVGALDYLIREAGEDYHIFLGTSVGALNAALIGQAQGRGELIKLVGLLKEIWLNLKGSRSVFAGSVLGPARLLFSDALFDPAGLRELLRRHLDSDRLFSTANVVKVSAVAMETGELLYACNKNPGLKGDFSRYVLASASIPLFFPAVVIDGKHWYDGGLRDVTPLGAVFQEQPDEIMVIVTMPLTEDLRPKLPETRVGGVFHRLLRAVDILTGEIAANDLQLAVAVNKCLQRFPGRRAVPIRVISPEQPLAGDGPLDFNPDRIRENMRLGYEAAHRPRLIAG
ncbi:MAG TPA: hypothetical protein GX391_03300 [Firmicutes bacterium]|jgi:NTE family protein|nr:hypothetical protein [Bacillota bacterium]HOQ24107.1 patatin-like phospholipase family protein [Bacillota bacterium]HPT66413.1 patatin-like phospholipase family protein [Bacillota bacterium]